MRLAFLLQHHLPGSGKALHLRRLLDACRREGHVCRIYCGSWRGDRLPEVETRLLPCRAWSRRGRLQRFAAAATAELERDPVDVVIGLDKLPGLDLYFATESCLRDDGLHYPGPLVRRSGEFRFRIDCERAVFAADSRTRVLLLSEQQQHSYARYYPQAAARWQVLPPGAGRDCCRPADAARRRERLRAELAAGPAQLLLLFAAPDPVAGGLGRAIHALAAVTARRPDLDYRLLVTGPERAGAQRRLARRAGVKAAVQFLGRREDLPQLLLAADALVHPALDEPGGAVILEALVAGLPVIASANCGYAHHIREAAAGVILPQPYRDDALSDAFERVSDGYFRHQCQDRALVYASRKDLYSMYETAAALLPELVAGARAPADQAR